MIFGVNACPGETGQMIRGIICGVYARSAGETGVITY